MTPMVNYPERDHAPACAVCGAHPEDCSHADARRVQIARDGVLIGEVLVERCMVDTFSPHNVFARLGGVVIQRADLPRTWDVPVGSVINPEQRRKAS